MIEIIYSIQIFLQTVKISSRIAILPQSPPRRAAYFSKSNFSSNERRAAFQRDRSRLAVREQRAQEVVGPASGQISPRNKQ